MPSFNICNYSACVYTYKCVWVCMQICMPKKRLSHIPNGACLINFLQFVHKHTYLHMWHICSYMLQGCSCLCAYYQSLGCLAAYPVSLPSHFPDSFTILFADCVVYDTNEYKMNNKHATSKSSLIGLCSTNKYAGILVHRYVKTV